MKKADIVEFYSRLRAANPAPTTELEYASPFPLLIAVILSAQATDVGVNKATSRLFPAAPTPAAMAALGEEGLTEYIKTIGLFRTKAKNVIATCRMLIELHDGQVPQDRAALEALPGVGRKTANVVLGNCFDVPGITVDTHVGRLSRRLGLTTLTDPVKVEHDLMAVIPAKDWTIFSHRMIYHGRQVCHARRTNCPQCVLEDICPKIGV